jgi:tRNA threonylcarbamoyladenosine biosynthesis protein TsaB
MYYALREKTMILAIDTATRWTALALHSGTAVLSEQGWYGRNTQTIELTPAIDTMLRRAEIEADELKAIVIALGPGSYTGLRVGLSVAKGLALANQTPLIGVPTLDIVAAAFQPLDHPLLAVAEAGRTRICAARYEWHGRSGWQNEQPPFTTTWEELLAEQEGPLTIAGEITAEAVRKIRAGGKGFQVAPVATWPRRAGFLAEIGWRRLRKGETDAADTLVPIYLRAPG